MTDVAPHASKTYVPPAEAASEPKKKQSNRQNKTKTHPSHSWTKEEWIRWRCECKKNATRWSARGMYPWAFAWENAIKTGIRPANTHDELDAETRKRCARSRPSIYQGVSSRTTSSGSAPESGWSVVKNNIDGKFVYTYFRNDNGMISQSDYTTYATATGLLDPEDLVSEDLVSEDLVSEEEA